jgi:ABC-type transporter Mla subunit MlaD
MDPLQYFDEEYSAINSSINNITSIVIECNDNVSQILKIQKRLQSISKNKDIDSKQLKEILDIISSLAQLSGTLLECTQSIKSKITFGANE